MGITLLKIKLMPTSPDTDLKKIKESARKVIEKGEGKNIEFEEEPIAFGLKAVIISFEISEDQDLDSIETSLGKLKDVSSAQVVDMRRAFG